MIPRGLALAFAGSAALTLAAGGTGYRLGRDTGRIEGRAAAYRETDRVLRDLEHALAPLVQGQAQAEHFAPTER